MHHITKGSESLRKLRERPRVGDEYERTSPTAGGGVRQYVETIHFNVHRDGKKWNLERGRSTIVYYLIGDERRAARIFVKEEPEFVEKCFSKKHAFNPIVQQTDELVGELIFQEYEIMKYNGEI